MHWRAVRSSMRATMSLVPPDSETPTGLRRPRFVLDAVPGQAGTEDVLVYDVLLPDRSRRLGTVTLRPDGRPGYAEAVLELAEEDPDLDPWLAAALESWFEDAWPFYGVNLTVSTSPSRIT